MWCVTDSIRLTDSAVNGYVGEGVVTEAVPVVALHLGTQARGRVWPLFLSLVAGAGRAAFLGTGTAWEREVRTTTSGTRC